MIRAATMEDERSVLALIDAWPTHFVDAARPLVRKDFREGRTFLCEEAGRALGFLTWKEVPDGVELLWMAVHPKAVGTGIGRSLVTEVERNTSPQKRVFLKTATTDSVLPGTVFSGPAYQGTNDFFVRLGYRPVERITDGWGPGNHVLVMEKRRGG